MNKSFNNKLAFYLFILVSTCISHISHADNWNDSLMLETQGKYAAAAKSLEIFTNQKPINEFAVLRHGWLNYLARNYNSAIKDYQQALTINPNSLDARLGLILPLMAQGRWREAALHAEKVLDVAPWQYYAHVRLLACEQAMQQWDILEKHAKRVAERYPTDATVQVYLARAYSSTGKIKQAINTYRRVAQMIPGHIEATRFIATSLNSK